MAKHHIMDQTGHSTIEFDANNTVELNDALARFKALTDNGHAAATRKAGTKDYTVVKAFDPGADETLFVSPMQGC
jgi:hypothetical protein